MHSGTNGKGQNLNSYTEVITVDFIKISYTSQYLALIVNSYNGKGFEGVETADVSIY